MTPSTPITDLAERTAGLWSGIRPTNAAAVALAAQFEGTIAAFTALRGTMKFEDEPASFAAALAATREGGQ